MRKLSQQKQAFTEQVIRESAYAGVMQVLSEYGLEKLTVQRVAAAANLATGTLYNYFKDKDDLLIYAAVRMFDELRRQQRQAIDCIKTPARKLQTFVESTFMFFSKNIGFFRFLDQAQVYCKIDVAVKHSHVNSELEFLSEIIQSGIDSGVFKKVAKVDDLASFFHRAMVGTLCVNTELGEFDPVKEAKSLTKIFTSFLV
jgi:AcrR family transcriptional regulator